MTSSESNAGKTKRPVYYSKFTLKDYLRTRMVGTTSDPPQPTRRDFMAAATNLRPSAKPFFPQLKLDPDAEEFQPRKASDRASRFCFVVVKSLGEDGNLLNCPLSLSFVFNSGGPDHSGPLSPGGDSQGPSEIFPSGQR